MPPSSFFFVLSICFALANCQQCTHSDVRLIGGSGDYEGNVQVCINGTWGYVCDSGWDDNAIAVVCSQLGYSASNSIKTTSSYYGYGNGVIWLDHLSCSGSEKSLIDCPLGAEIGAASCSQAELAGVFCYGNGNATCSNGDIRLAKSSLTTYGRSEGRVEVCHDNEWGTVCDDGWDSNDATVACKQLGYYSYYTYYYSAYYGSGSGQIWLSYLSCSGSENSLFSCSANSIGDHHCTHSEDVGVKCNSRNASSSSCTDGDVKLWSAYNHVAEGIVLVCNSGSWRVLHDSSSCYAAKLACLAAGYVGLKGTRTDGGIYYGVYYGESYYRYTCSSSDKTLSDCSQSNYGSHNDQSLGVICTMPSTITNCTNGDIQLVGGKSDSEGRVEHCYNGEWVAVCSLSAYTATLVCNYFGYNEGIAVNDERFGRSSVISEFQYLSCPHSNTEITQCLSEVDSSCPPTTCSVHYGVICIDSCTHGDVRLVGGSDYEGNVQVCFNGTWGYVCDNSWNNKDAKVVCSQLGYSTSHATYRYGSFYGFGHGNVWLDGMNCTGSEKTLLTCSHGAVAVENVHCGYDKMAGVFCPYGNFCRNGDIRLANFYPNKYGRSEGRVEICHDNEWGTICDIGWNSYYEGIVACKQLKFSSNYSPHTYSNAYFGAGIGTVWLNNVDCTGQEDSLAECSSSGFGINNCAHSKDAGVRCYGRDTSSCTHNEVKLWSAFDITPSDEGTVLLCQNGQWYPLYYTTSCKVAELACKALGYEEVKFTRSSSGNYYGYYYSTYYLLTCSDSAQSLSDCLYTTDSNEYSRSLGVKCGESTPVSNCTEGEVRLSDGSTDNEGRIEYCYDNRWTAVCSLNSLTADLICLKLGYNYWKAISDERYGRTNSNNFHLSCPQRSSDLNECSVDSSLCTCEVQYGLVCSNNCTHGDVRLVGGSGDYEGNVQVCINGTWGYVCDNSWDNDDAKVVCSQLGYSTTYATHRPGSFYGFGGGTVWLENVYCTGSEKKLLDCSHGADGDVYCDHNKMAGIFCPYGGICTNGDIRLANFYPSSYSRNEGRVEVCHNNEWGTVCDDGWNGNTATVACEQLGFSNYYTYYYSSYYGAGVGPIWLDELSCSGDENSLFSCSSNDLGDHDCGGHSEDAGLRCYDQDTSSCINDEVRLWSAFDFTPIDEGTVMICKKNTWHPFYRTSSCKVAELACEAMGYVEVENMRSDSGKYYGHFYASAYYSFICANSAQSLSDCTYSKITSHGYYYSLGVKCKKPVLASNCSEGAVRLSGGLSDNEGRIEYCFESRWRSVCSLSTLIAELICNDYGYKEWSIVSDERFGRSDSIGGDFHLSCPSGSTNLDQCSADNSFCSVTLCVTQFGLICTDNCTHGDVRLVGGSGDYEGNVQVCINGTWGYVCDNSWSSQEAQVVCKQLGHTSSSATPRIGSFYGLGDSHQAWLDTLQCAGSENGILNCPYTLLATGSGDCGDSKIAGVYCPFAKCRNGDIRLVNFYTNNYGRSEGRIEVCQTNTWGTVCDDGWNNVDATVACKQLGYYDYISYYIDYGDGTGSIWLGNLNCDGTESSLFSCSESGTQNCYHYEDVGVRCYSKDSTSCTDGDLKLWSAYDAIPDNEGIPLICKSGTFYPVYYTSDCNVADLICDAMGYKDLERLVSSAAGKYYGYYSSTFYKYTCSNSAQSLSDCTQTSYANQYSYSLGLKCEGNITTSSCASGDVRLSGSDVEYEGRVEYCYRNEWSPMCAMSSITARLVCNELGYKEGKIVFNERFDRLKSTSRFQYLTCTMAHTNISQCSITTSSCGSKSCTTQYGLTCFDECIHGDVRLVSGSGDYEGNVQVCINGTWGYVCDNTWESNDAKVVCQQLGYSISDGTHRIASFYGYGSDQNNYWLDSVNCTGSENNLMECSFGDKTTCSSNNIAGAFCPETGYIACTNGDIRLASSSISTYGRSEGRVEVCHDNEWGTVCDDGWSSNDATVACKQLGYYSYYNYYSSAYYGSGSGQIWLSYLSCSGSENSLFSCNGNSIGDHHCTHSEDAGVKCYSRDLSTCTNGAIKLWSAYDNTPNDEGIVLVCTSGIWYPMHHSSNCHAAEKACIETGFTDVKYTRTDGGKFYGSYYQTHYYYSCSINDKYLKDCYRSSYGSQYYASLGVKCTAAKINASCNDGDIRLSDGEEEYSGRVEYCYNGEWSPLCSVSSTTAKLICRSLGKNEWKIKVDEQFSRSDIVSKFQTLSCSASFTNISECSIITSCTPTNCSIQYGLQCTDICADSDVRLVGGSGDYEGNVQVCINGTWGYVCDNSWSTNDANVVCRQLGYFETDAVVRSSSFYGYGSGMIWLNNLYCSGSEKSLLNCSSGSGLGEGFCEYSKMAGVFCLSGSCRNGDIRLVNSYVSSYGRSEGRVEVCHEDQWGTVCDDGWNSNDATVACKELGFYDYISYYYSAYYGAGSGPIWLDNLNCQGLETSLLSCPSNTIGDHNCGHSEDAGIKCYARDDSSCSDGDVKLWSSFDSTPEDEGIVLVCKGSSWFPIYHEAECTVADAACKSMGYTGMKYIRKNGGKHYGYLYSSKIYTFTCSINDETLADCTETVSTGYQYYYSLSVKCESIKSSSNCTSGNLRLADGGVSNEGRVEYCYNNQWSAMCSLKPSTAKLICLHLGYEEYNIIRNEKFGRLDFSSKFQHLSCSSKNTNISECSEYNTSCTTSCSIQYGLICSHNCTHGDVRLVGGFDDYEGNVQACINGTWGYICDSNWDSSDAKVVCSQLGYSTTNAVHRAASYYGHRTDIVLLNKVQCTGTEARLFDCPMGTTAGEAFCDLNEHAGVFCSYGGSECSTGDIRLSNYYSSSYGRSEGRVEVCYNGEWGSVCDDGWSSNDATVACKQLGFENYIKSYAYYGAGYGSIWLSNLNCQGTESKLFSCSANPIGSHHCSHNEDAGVMCYGKDSSSCSVGSIKLWSAFSSTPDNEGIVLVCQSGTWYPLLDSSNCHAAELACNATGHSGLRYIKNNAGQYYGFYYATHYYYSCPNSEQFLSKCSQTSYSNQHYTNTLGVVCEISKNLTSPLASSNCTNGDVRLTNGILESEGRVEYCFNNEWAPLCSLNQFTANLICNEFGYSTVSGSFIVQDERFGISDTVSKFQHLGCSSSYSDLSQCSVSTSCFPSTCLIQYGLRCNESCTYGDLRLIGGSGDYEGNVQVCINGTWGYVCDNDWDSNDAEVVCKQLGYTSLNVQYKQSSYYGYGDGDVWMDNVYCNGLEGQLIDCSLGAEIGSTVCDYDAMAGAFCTSGGNNCNSGGIRLVNSNSYGRSEGRIEVCYNNEWGTVCNDGWSSNDATVACKQLGFYDYISYYTYTYYGAGSGSIWLTQLNCQGGESSLFSCPTPNSIGVHNCNHFEDVGVNCYSKEISSCTNGDVRLWSAYDTTPSDEGMVQICKTGSWYPLYYTADCVVARLACNAAGFSLLSYIRSNAGKYYSYYYNTHYRYTCSSSANSLSDCSESSYSESYYTNSLGLKCESQSTSSDCTDNSVRLSNGVLSNEGRVEYCYNGGWKAMCSVSSHVANLICKTLGYSEWSLIYSDERFGRLNAKSIFESLSCSSTDTALSDCTINIGCIQSVCTTEYSIRCFNQTLSECVEGDVRLVDGDIEQEGRPEVCVDGIWGSICHNDWTSNDAYATCLTLGYEGSSSPSVYFNSYFGTGNGPIVWNYVACKYWDRNIFDCTKSVYPSFTCTANQVAGLRCTEGCSNGDMRLVGGDYDNEGTVEICFEDVWGLISDVKWTSADAQVVCNKLGHSEGIAKPILNSYYGKPQKTIHLKDVSCVGQETDLTECTSTQLSVSLGKQLLSETEVAGVDCVHDEPTPPPCVINPSITPNDSCTSKGSVRLMNNGIVSTIEGRVEYCNGKYWTPLCTIDNRAAAVICGQLGQIHYQWGSFSNGDYGTLLNYSLIENVTCSGSESQLSECTTHEPVENCLPWCPENIALRCYNPGICEEGSVRLVDGVIENEGRIEVCVNEVWGSICDEGWDTTDGHVVCQQLGHPELEPIIFLDSHFGDSKYPMVYSNINCGGWENELKECDKEGYMKVDCSNGNTAGLLCGFDCEDGDVQLNGGGSDNEGTVEVCFNNIWGLIGETGWTSKDAEVVCKQLGYPVEGTVIKSESYYGKPNKTVHINNVQCSGDENRIEECTHTKYALNEGKMKLDALTVAGVKCFQESFKVSISSTSVISTSTSSTFVISTTPTSSTSVISTPTSSTKYIRSTSVTSSSASVFVRDTVSTSSSAVLPKSNQDEANQMSPALYVLIAVVLVLIILIVIIVIALISVTRRNRAYQPTSDLDVQLVRQRVNPFSSPYEIPLPSADIMSSTNAAYGNTDKDQEKIYEDMQM